MTGAKALACLTEASVTEEEMVYCFESQRSSGGFHPDMFQFYEQL
jgi:hypothetical protein